jgi:hypothetical protein
MVSRCRSIDDEGDGGLGVRESVGMRELGTWFAIGEQLKTSFKDETNTETDTYFRGLSSHMTCCSYISWSIWICGMTLRQGRPHRPDDLGLGYSFVVDEICSVDYADESTERKDTLGPVVLGNDKGVEAGGPIFIFAFKAESPGKAQLRASRYTRKRPYKHHGIRIERRVP